VTLRKEPDRVDEVQAQTPPVQNNADNQTATVTQQSAGEMVLPGSIASKIDTGRLLREIEAYDDHMHQEALRKSTDSLPKYDFSNMLNELFAVNNIDPVHAAQCQRAMDFIKYVHDTAPVMHMSFSADPSPLFTKKLVTWMRKEIHPLVLVQVGLQPNIGAGCIVRTTNKQFDFSLRQRFKQKREQLLNFFVRANTIAQPEVAGPVPGEAGNP
jgi:hypothetical protein